MAHHALSDHFASFFARLNPSPSFVRTASSEHRTVTGLIEGTRGTAAELEPHCFLQGSYKQDTAIYTINDVDIVVLCRLWQGGDGGGSGRSWDRDAIFAAIAEPLLQDGRYRSKVRFHARSMCIKVELGIKLEILPVVYKAGTSDPDAEPFRLYRPETGEWADGYARMHQDWLTWKNKRTDGNFIPAIKVFKHLRSHFGLEAVSFHIECLLFRLPDELFAGGPADSIAVLLRQLVASDADAWYARPIRTPCEERDIFVSSEWQRESWHAFHRAAITWAKCADQARACPDRSTAIEFWRLLLGEDFFPEQVSR